MFPFNEPLNRLKNSTSVINYDEDGNIVDSFVVDQFPGKEFCIGQFGFPLSDIALIEKAQTQKEFELLASRLQEIEVPNIDKSKKSDQDIIKNLMPAWVQSPSEIAKFADYYNELNPVEKEKIDESKVVEDGKVDVQSPDSSES